MISVIMRMQELMVKLIGFAECRHTRRVLSVGEATQGYLSVLDMGREVCMVTALPSLTARVPPIYSSPC